MNPLPKPRPPEGRHWTPDLAPGLYWMRYTRMGAMPFVAEIDAEGTARMMNGGRAFLANAIVNRNCSILGPVHDYAHVRDLEERLRVAENRLREIEEENEENERAVAGYRDLRWTSPPRGLAGTYETTMAKHPEWLIHFENGACLHIPKDNPEAMHYGPEPRLMEPTPPEPAPDEEWKPDARVGWANLPMHVREIARSKCTGTGGI